jgi:hypothetical protein
MPPDSRQVRPFAEPRGCSRRSPRSRGPRVQRLRRRRPSVVGPSLVARASPPGPPQGSSRRWPRTSGPKGIETSPTTMADTPGPSPIAWATPKTGGTPWRALRTDQDDVPPTPCSARSVPSSSSVPPPGRPEGLQPTAPHPPPCTGGAPVGRCATADRRGAGTGRSRGDHASAGADEHLRQPAPRPSRLRSCCTSGQM